MPRFSEFYGIAIYMYYRDHTPPRFNVRYSGLKAAVDIRTGNVVASELPKRALRLVAEWHHAHRTELLDRWEQARRGETLTPIMPLP